MCKRDILKTNEPHSESDISNIFCCIFAHITQIIPNIDGTRVWISNMSSYILNMHEDIKPCVTFLCRINRFLCIFSESAANAASCPFFNPEAASTCSSEELRVHNPNFSSCVCVEQQQWFLLNHRPDHILGAGMFATR